MKVVTYGNQQPTPHNTASLSPNGHQLTNCKKPSVDGSLRQDPFMFSLLLLLMFSPDKTQSLTWKLCDSNLNLITS